MDFYKKMISLYVFITMTALVIAEKCDYFTCQSLSENVCWTDKDKVKSGIQLNPCPKGYHCPINNADSVKTCMKDEVIVAKLYPGSKCTVNEDCFSNVCDPALKKCVGSKTGEVCKDHDDCSIGEACYDKEGKNVCQVLKADNADCKSSFECPRTHGCLNSKCTPYFSSDASTAVVEENEFPHISFCKSGKSVEGVCRNLELQTKTCTDSNTCEYKIEDGTTIKIDINCACGFNKDAEKYCKQGTTNQVYIDFVDRTKNFLSLQDCHTLERNEQCNYYKRFPEEKKDITKKYTNSIILSDKSNVLANADKCVLAVAFPNYDGSVDPEPPIVVTPKCARYACEKNSENICALGHYNDTLKYSHVSLNDICKDSQYCATSSPYPFDEFTKTTDKDVKGTCTNKTNINIQNFAYPGEACTKQTDCYKDSVFPKLGNCENKVCTGSKVDEDCGDNHHCLSGNYCEKSKCKAQKKENDPCESHYECGNAFVCVESKCQKKYYSLPAGSKADSDFLCQTGKRTINGECTYLKSTGTKNVTEANLTRCEYGKQCTYTDHTGAALVIDCQCGYNADGIGYCPRDDDDSKLF
jgi:hypothetical protein